MREQKILKSVEKKIEVVLKKKHEPSKFFENRDGLYVLSSFKDNIVNKAKETKAKAKFRIASFDLTERSNDNDIEKALPKEHIFSETDVCAIIAGLIEKQPKGEDGILQNNGYFNLFYTPSRVVYVIWLGDEWHAGVWPRDGYAWYEGFRVFSPATEI